MHYNDYHFLVSVSDDRLLPPFMDNHAGALYTGGEEGEDAPPAVADVKAVPSLGMAGNPHLAVNRTVRISVQKKPAQQHILQNRLLFLNNPG